MKENTKQSAWVSIFKLTPVLLLAYLMMPGLKIGPITFGLDYDILIVAPISAAYACIVAYLTEGLKPSDAVDIGIKNVDHILIALFILMMAYAMANAFMQTGVGAAIVLFCLRLGLSAKTIAPVGLVATSLLSLATGSSWGTFAACVPIFLWMNHIVGGDILLTTGAIAGGACFGDSIGLISDTNVVSSGIQGVEVIDRVRHQSILAILCLAIAIVLYFITSSHLPSTTASGAEAVASIPQETFDMLAVENPAALSLLNQIGEGVPMVMMIPLFIVIGTAIIGWPTLICLLIGLISSLVLGLGVGTVESFDFFLINIVQSGFAEAGSWVIIMMMWIAFFGGVMNEMHAFEPLSRGVLKLSRSVRSLMTWNGILCILGNALLADEMAQIVTIGPIIKDLVDENIEGSEEDMYELHLRNATFSGSIGVFGSQLLPWHVYITYYVSMATAVYPLHHFKATELIANNYLAFLSVATVLIFTATGLDRLIPLFNLPTEPDVRFLKDEKASKEA